MRASKRPQALIVWQLQRKVPIRRHTKWPLLYLWVAEPSLVQASQGCAVLCCALPGAGTCPPYTRNMKRILY